MAGNLDIQSALSGFNMGYEIRFQDLYDQTDPGFYGMWTEEIQAAGEQALTQAFLTNTPIMREWTGAKQYGNLRAYSQVITPKQYEATLSLKRFIVDNDKTGVVGKKIDGLAATAKDFYDTTVAASFDSNSGAGPTGYDGVALFATNHPDAPSAGTQSNLDAAANLSHATLVTAEYSGGLLTEENGRLLRIQYNTLRVGLKLKRRALELVSADRVSIVGAGGKLDTAPAVTDTDRIVGAATRSSTWQGDMTVVVDPRVSNYYWTLIDTTKPAKPMSLFVVRAPELISQNRMEDPLRFEHDLYAWSVESDVGVAAGHWAVVRRGTGTE